MAATKNSTTEAKATTPEPKAKPEASDFKTMDEAIHAKVSVAKIAAHFKVRTRDVNMRRFDLGLIDPSTPMGGYWKKCVERRDNIVTVPDSPGGKAKTSTKTAAKKPAVKTVRKNGKVTLKKTTPAPKSADDIARDTRAREGVPA